ncbi:MAG TPA: hypothetical protein VF292_03640 [Rhodanobacteraceae bacterium]
MKGRSMLCTAALVAGGCLLAGCVVAPPRRVDVVAVAPARVWVPGYWGRGHVWVRGYWRYR